MQVSAWLTRTRNGLAHCWSWLRQVSEDDAYERYRAADSQDCAEAKLTAADFYRQRLNHKYSRPSRCC